VLLITVEVVVVALTTCNNLPPAAGAAHFKPVASALSATNVWPSVPTARTNGVAEALAPIKSLWQ
jgi:hypothetical protein